MRMESRKLDIMNEIMPRVNGFKTPNMYILWEFELKVIIWELGLGIVIKDLQSLLRFSSYFNQWITEYIKLLDAYI